MSKVLEKQCFGLTRLIVQGSARDESFPRPLSPLGIALANPNNESLLGYTYVAELGPYLLDHNIDVIQDLIQYKFPTYHLIMVPSSNVYTVVGNLYRQFANRASPDFIELVEPDFTLNILAPSSKIGTGFSLTAGTSKHRTYLNDLNVAAATSNGIDGTNVKIAVLDTGLDPTRTIPGYHDVTVSPHRLKIDNHGHGTAMTDIISAVAKNAKIYAIRVSDTGQVFVWDLMAGVTAAVHNVGADIINLSLGCKDLDLACAVCGGGSNRSTVCEKFFDLIAQNAQIRGAPDPLILAAAGNDGVTTGFEWPARYPTVVAVGSVTHSKDRSTFSNTGTTKPKRQYCMCPGGEINSTGTVAEYVGEGIDASGKTTYCVGTSPATAYASGVLALLRHYRSKYGHSITSAALLDTAELKAKTDIKGYTSADHGMGRLIYDP